MSVAQLGRRQLTKVPPYARGLLLAWVAAWAALVFVIFSSQ